MTDDVATRIWLDASTQPHIEAGWRGIYREIAQATGERTPRCDRSGRCCHFEQFGHRMYVTGLEVATFLKRLNRTISPADLARAERDGACPFLEHGECSVHDIRPMGCRIYFCDPQAQEWQNELYERSHQRATELHTDHAIPYRYGEWRRMLGLVLGAEEVAAAEANSPSARASHRFVDVTITR